MNFFVQNREKLYDSIPENSVLLLFAGSLQQKSSDAFYSY